MRLLLFSVALGASIVAFLGALGIGLFLAAVDVSGERGAGVLLMLGATLAFGSSMLVMFGPSRLFRGSARALAFVAGLIAIVPLVAISAVALLFSGNPLGSELPALDGAMFAVGVLLAAGTVAMVALVLSKARGPRQPGAFAKAGQAGNGSQAGQPSAAVPEDDDEEVRVIAG